MFRWEDEDSPPPSPPPPVALLLTPSPPIDSPPPPSSSFSSWVEVFLGGASVRELSLTELAGEEDDEEAVLVEDRGFSCWAELLLSKGAGPVAEVNRCSGGSEVLVEIQASSRTRRSSRKPKSSVTSSPTPSIRAIAR